MAPEDRRGFARNVHKSFAYVVLMEFGLWIPIWVLYLRDQRHFSLAQITFLDVPFFVLMVFAEIPTGAVADRFGRKVSLALAAGCFGVAIFVFGVATNYPVIFASYVAWGFSITFRSGADSALLYDSLKQLGREDEFTRINGRLTACRWTTTLVSLLIGAPVAAMTSYTFVIKLTAINSAIALVVAMRMHEPRHSDEHSAERYLTALAAGVREAWQSPPLRYAFLYGGLLGAVAFGPLVVYQQPWLAAHGVTTAGQGLWQSPARIAAIVGAALTARLVARIGERALFAAMPLIIVVCTLTLGGVDHTAAASAFVGMGFVNGLQMPLLAAYVNHRVDSRHRATALSAGAAVSSVALAVFNPVGGIVADALGLQAAFILFGVVCLVAVGGSLVLWFRAEAREPLSPAT